MSYASSGNNLVVGVHPAQLNNAQLDMQGGKRLLSEL
jgi:hypothetical protein